MKRERKIVCIVGPTASGKTGWGVKIAKKFNSEIISADSRQVYKKLNIGTGKDLKEYGEIKYHLIDICNPGERFTMFDWLEQARVAVDDIFSRGKLPVVVGGTGLYVQALVEGFELEKTAGCHPELDSRSRFRIRSGMTKNYSREELEAKTLKELQKICLQLTTYSLQLDQNNSHRLIRAIERVQNGEITTKKKPDFQALQIAIDLPRDVLYNRIDSRVEERFSQGMLEEVKYLLASGVNPDWLLSLGLEYRIIGDYILNGKQSFSEMKQELKYKIHAFARRQLTWFRRFREIVWCSDLKSVENEVKKFLL